MYEETEDVIIGVFDDFKLIMNYANKNGFVQDSVDRFFFKKAEEILIVEMTKLNETNVGCA
jgi:hypothetical protein